MRFLGALLLLIATAATGDYYATLEVDKKATQKEIKASYRRLALKHHPDKNPEDRAGAEERFRDVAAAYEVLGDEKLRKRYDAGGGKGGFPGGGGRGGFGRGGHPFRNANDIFADFFGTSDPFAAFEKIFDDLDGGGDGDPFGGADPFAGMMGGMFGKMGGNMGGARSSFSFSSSTMTSSGGKTVTKTMKTSTDGSGRSTRSASLEESVGGRRTRRMEIEKDGENKAKARKVGGGAPRPFGRLDL